MTSLLVSPDQARQVARILFSRLHPGQELWFDLAWESLGTKIRPDVGDLGWGALPGLGAVGAPDSVTEQMAKTFAALAATFLVHSALARDELLKELKHQSAQSGHLDAITQWLVDEAKAAMTHGNEQYHVWACHIGETCARYFGPMDRETAVAEYVANAERYDVFVDGLSIVFRGQSQRKGRGDGNLRGLRAKCLTVFLINRGREMQAESLYARLITLPPEKRATERAAMLDYLSPTLNHIAADIQKLLPAFDIPKKRVNSGYSCTGKFSSCVILPDTSLASHTVACL